MKEVENPDVAGPFMLIFDKILPVDSDDTILQEPGIMYILNAHELARQGYFTENNKEIWRRATFENGYPLITDQIND